MKSTFVCLCVLLSFCLSSCLHYAYYQNPMHTNMHAYRAMPLKSDSASTAVYGDVNLFTGFANQNWRDDVSGGSAGLHVAHNFGEFQASYGINGTLGRYRASDFGLPELAISDPDNPDESFLDSINGSKFFGSAGFHGAINYVKPFANGGEWRAFGLEFNYQREWDNDYQAFRNKIPTGRANVVDYGRNYSALSLTTELIFRGKDRYSYGYKLAMGVATQKVLRYFSSAEPNKTLYRSHFSQTFHMGNDRVTGYGQFTVGYRASSLHFGLNFRLR